MNILKDPTKEAHCLVCDQKMSGPERLAWAQRKLPGATYMANPSEEVVYKEHIEYNEGVPVGWIACVYERREK